MIKELLDQSYPIYKQLLLKKKREKKYCLTHKKHVIML